MVIIPTSGIVAATALGPAGMGGSGVRGAAAAAAGGTWLAVAYGLAFGVGLMGAVWLALVTPRRHGEVAGRARPRAAAPGRRVAVLPLLGALAVGGIAGVVTGWPVAVVLGASAAWGVPRLLRRTSGMAVIDRVEAIAVWTEMLHGTLAASAGLQQAIVVTAPLAPRPLRPATGRLAARLRAGVPTRTALLGFADELADPSSDRVVCALLLAVDARVQRLGDLLANLADSTRDEVAMRLRIETSRAAVRSGVRTVLVSSLVFAVGLAVLARPYLSPFDSPRGQLVLALVGTLYGTGLVVMVRLAAPKAAVRLLGARAPAGPGGEDIAFRMPATGRRPILGRKQLPPARSGGGGGYGGGDG